MTKQKIKEITLTVRDENGSPIKSIVVPTEEVSPTIMSYEFGDLYDHEGKPVKTSSELEGFNTHIIFGVGLMGSILMKKEGINFTRELPGVLPITHEDYVNTRPGFSPDLDEEDKIDIDSVLCEASKIKLSGLEGNNVVFVSLYWNEETLVLDSIRLYFHAEEKSYSLHMKFEDVDDVDEISELGRLPAYLTRFSLHVLDRMQDDEEMSE